MTENFSESDMVHVDSYTRENGTFVNEYWRKKPDKGHDESVVSAENKDNYSEETDVQIDTLQTVTEEGADTQKKVLEGSVQISEYLPLMVDVEESGILDTIKEALSKIDTDEIKNSNYNQVLRYALCPSTSPMDMKEKIRI